MAKRPDNGLGTTDIDLLLSPKRREIQKTFLITSPPPSAGPEGEDFWASDNVGPVSDNARVSNNNQIEKGKGKEKEKVTNYGEDLDFFEDDSMDFDPKFLEGLDTIEKEAYNRITAPPSSALLSISRSSDKSCSSAVALPSMGISAIQTTEVITIEDDEDGDADDKENVPVPTRHVRRRTEADGRGGLGARALSGSQRSRDPARPTILAKTASAVIDLSDSD